MEDEIFETLLTAIEERISISPYRYLCENSLEFKELLKSNEELTKKYPRISMILEHRTNEQETYSTKEAIALSNYLLNKQHMELLLQKEIYKLGVHDAIKALYNIHILSSNSLIL